MKRTCWRSLTLTSVSVVALVFLACNSLLDNNPGLLRESDDAGPHRTPVGTTAPPESPPDASTDGGEGTPDSNTGEPSSPGCPDGQRLCNGACVGLTDPVYGCGDPSCAPCPSSHSSMGCQGEVRRHRVRPGLRELQRDPPTAARRISRRPRAAAHATRCAPSAAPLCAPEGRASSARTAARRPLRSDAETSASTR